MAHTTERIHESAFIQEDINPELIMICPNRRRKVIGNGVRKLLSSGVTTSLALRNELRIKDGAIAVQKCNDSMALGSATIK